MRQNINDGCGSTLIGELCARVRASGTEPLIRIMVEGQDIGEIEAIAREIADVIKG